MKTAILVEKEEWQHINQRLAVLEQSISTLPKTGTDLAPMSAGEVASRFHVARAIVLKALRNGKLRATCRDSRGGKRWDIDQADAHRWFKKFISKESNQ